MEPDQYKPTVLAKLFHRLPHLNITLHFVNATFIPDSETYLESLGILASLPAAWVILTLFVLLVYLCTRCCDRKPRPKHSISLLKWTLSIFTLLCCGAIGVGLYGNDDVHSAVVHFVMAIKAINEKISAVKNQTGTIESTLQLKVKPLLTELSDIFDDPVANQTARALLLVGLNAVIGNTSSALSSSQDISRPLQGINLKPIINYVQLVETIRWPATMGVLSILLVFCVILLFGVARHSRCCLITFSVFGLFAVIINWLLTSVYLTVSVALGDLCIAPEDFLRYESPSTLQAEVLKYYMRCEPSHMNPFTQRLREAQRGVDAMTANLGIVAKLADQLYHKNDLHPRLDILTKDINLADKLVSSLAALLDCRPLHKQYLAAVRSVCDLGLYGMAFMLLASVSAGLLFTVLVWVDSHTWIYIRKRRDYLQVDEQDPFLPPSAASQAIAARTLRNQGSYNTPPHSASSLKRYPSARSAVEPSPSMSHRYTPLNPNPFALNLSNDTKDFQKYLKNTVNVYYDPNLSETKKDGKSESYDFANENTENSSQDVSPSYGYYSSIPVNSNLTSRFRGFIYSDRENEFVSVNTADWVKSQQQQACETGTLESTWSPKTTFQVVVFQLLVIPRLWVVVLFFRCCCRSCFALGNGEEKSKYGPYRESNLGGGMRGGHIHSHPHTHSTLPRAHLSGPNHGQYATLSKQCKTLESSDFY